MFTMPMAPLVVNQTSGDWMWTAASVLGLRSPKLEFDPSLPKDFDGDETANDSGLSMLERYVAKLLDASFADSSLFWHYAMRHVPSPSLMCAKVSDCVSLLMFAHCLTMFLEQDYSSTNYKPAGTNMQFSNDAGIPSDTSNPSITTNLPSDVPVHGYGAFPLGGAATTCFCGWTRVVVGTAVWCQVPVAACTYVGLRATNAQCRSVSAACSPLGISMSDFVLQVPEGLAGRAGRGCEAPRGLATVSQGQCHSHHVGMP